MTRLHRDALFAWVVARRLGHLDATPHRIVGALSVEALPYRKIPTRLLAAVVEFRHLSHERRVAAAEKWLWS